MGHIRLGAIPKSQPWKRVVSSVVTNVGLGAGGAAGSAFVASTSEDTDSKVYSVGGQTRELDTRSVSLIAFKTLEAAEKGLDRAASDKGLCLTFFLLTQIALASRVEDWSAELRKNGIVLQSSDSLNDLTRAFQNAVDRGLERTGDSSDIGEMAQRAAGDALSKLAADQAATLFGNSGEELRVAVRSLSTPAGFGALGQMFFGSFLSRFLNFYLSRITASELGRGTLGDLSDITRFNSQLARHCEQSAAIVRDFSGEWYSKTEYLHGISLARTRGFVAIAVKKLKAELRAQQDER
jgi:hypothetical protein